MGGHHLTLGSLVDFVTGATRQDTHDERYRQKLAMLLVNEKGYPKEELECGTPVTISAGSGRAILTAGILITIDGQYRMLLQYGPGSIVSRRRPALALSRIIAPFQIPLVVATNGQTADIMEGASGKVLGTGLSAIPTRNALIRRTQNTPCSPLSPRRIEMESRILFAFEVDGSCPCDDTICRL